MMNFGRVKAGSPDEMSLIDSRLPLIDPEEPATLVPSGQISDRRCTSAKAPPVLTPTLT